MPISERNRAGLKISCGGCYNQKGRGGRRNEVVERLDSSIVEPPKSPENILPQALKILCDACKETGYKTPYIQRFLRLKEKEESNRGK